MPPDESAQTGSVPREDGSQALAAHGADAQTPAEQGGDAPKANEAAITRRRHIAVNVLIVVTTLLLVVGVFAVFANRLLFSPDNFSNTSTQLLASPTIRSAVANYTVDQIYANVNVPDLIKSGLPPRLQPLASPAAGALENVAVQGVNRLLTRPRVQDGWAKASRAADQTFIAIANGGKGSVAVNGGKVTLNLSQVVDQIALRLGLPKNLGAKLPPNVANLTLFTSKQLSFVQKAGKATKNLALWLTILVPLLYLLAIFLARGYRRRTLMNVGFALVIGGLTVILARQVTVNQIVSSLTKDASLRPAVTETVSISTQILHQIAAACILVGSVVVVCGWFAGPARPARVVREGIAPFLREQPIATYGVTLAVMALIFIWNPIHATGTPAGIIVFTLLALFGTYCLRRQTEEEFPEARMGATTAKFRAWRARRRQERSGASGSSNGSGETMPEQLGQLADLRDRGAISGDEYETAKAQLLQAGS